MIQSDNSESKNINMKKILNNSVNFVVKRLIELFGLLFLIISILLLISLISFSPEDPNFIFSDRTEIKNLLGQRGSYISDALFQSFGLICFLIPITIFFTGISTIRSKKFLLFIRNLFWMTIYLITGSFFFSIFYSESFNLTINGNGGFVGTYISNHLLSSFNNLQNEILYFLLILLVLIFFLISINFKISHIIYILQSLKINFSKKNKISKNNDINGNFYVSNDIKEDVENRS